MIWKAAVSRSRKEADNESKSRISDEKPEEDFTAGSSGAGHRSCFYTAMQQNTGVPKSIVDTITAIFIIVATMELLFQFNKKRKAKADAQ